MEARRLCHLASDLMSAISRLIDVQDLFALWSCGDIRLCKLMALSVDRFELAYGDTMHRDWPALLSIFPNLKEVSVAVTNALSRKEYDPLFVDNTTSKSANLQHLPKGLKKLHFAFPNDMELFAFPDSSQQPSLAQIRERFPELRYFHCQSSVSLAELSENERWPDTLEILSIERCSLLVAHLEQLPKNLVWLDCALAPEQSFSDAIEYFPPTLQTLKLSNVVNHDIYACVPSSVTELDLRFPGANWLPAPHGWNLLKSPGNLLSLTVKYASLDDGLVPFIPPCLTYLKLLNNTPVAASIVENLPGSLKVFELETSRPRAILFSTAKLPRGLVSLPEELFSAMLIEQWEDLPRSLKNMSCCLLRGSHHTLATLPPHLTSLKLDALTDNDVPYLPTTLTSLKIVGTRRKVAFSARLNLPRLSSLVTGHLIDNEFYHATLNDLTQSLDTLILSEVMRPDDFDFSGIWASRLCVLKLSIVRAHPLHRPVEFVARLPAHLVDLTLTFPVSREAPSEILTVLPPKLRACQLKGVQRPNNDTLQRLTARHLNKLYIGSSVLRRTSALTHPGTAPEPENRISAEALLSLPRSLTELTLSTPVEPHLEAGLQQLMAPRFPYLSSAFINRKRVVVAMAE